LSSCQYLHPFYQDTTGTTGEKSDGVQFSLVNRVTTSSWGNSSCTHDSNAILMAQPMFPGSSNPTVISTILSDLTGSEQSKCRFSYHGMADIQIARLLTTDSYGIGQYSGLVSQSGCAILRWSRLRHDEPVTVFIHSA